jgi:glutamine amidotransferase PdxT
MARYNTVLHQMVTILSRHEYESPVKSHHTGQRFRSFSGGSQFPAVFVRQPSARGNLRDLVDNHCHTETNTLFSEYAACNKEDLHRTSSHPYRVYAPGEKDVVLAQRLPLFCSTGTQNR